MGALRAEHGDELPKIGAAVAGRKALQAELEATRTALRDDWAAAMRWLTDFECVGAGGRYSLPPSSCGDNETEHSVGSSRLEAASLPPSRSHRLINH